MEFVEISEKVLKSLITPIKDRLHIRNTLKNHGNLRNHLLKSLPAAGRCVIERACSSFSELSCSHFFHGNIFAMASLILITEGLDSSNFNIGIPLNSWSMI